MKRKILLDSIKVQSPCSESWEEMTGSDEVRFCSHCAKNVHNLSAMTRKKAEELIRNSNGKLCVRYVKTPEGKLVTAPPKLTQITRRATIAAGVLATTLTLSTLAYAQNEPVKPKDTSTQTKKNQTQKDAEKQGLSTISGTISDSNQAVIPGVTVTLREIKTNRIQIARTNENGLYEFKEIEPGVYELTAESLGFKKLVIQNIDVLKDARLAKNVVLVVADTTIGVVDIVRDPPIEMKSPTVSTEPIEQRPMIEIPLNNQSFTMGYLIKDLPMSSQNVLNLLKLQPVNPKETDSKPKKKKN